MISDSQTEVTCKDMRRSFNKPGSGHEDTWADVIELAGVLEVRDVVEGKGVLMLQASAQAGSFKAVWKLNLCPMPQCCVQ